MCFLTVFLKCISQLHLLCLWVGERSGCMSQILDCCQTGPNHIPLPRGTLKLVIFNFSFYNHLNFLLKEIGHNIFPLPSCPHHEDIFEA